MIFGNLLVNGQVVVNRVELEHKGDIGDVLLILVKGIIILNDFVILILVQEIPYLK